MTVHPFKNWNKAYSHLTLMGLFCGVVLLHGCKSEESGVATPEGGEKAITLQASIDGLRAYETTWEKGDAIGVYAVRQGQLLGASTQYGQVGNARYTTPNGDGRFTADGAGIRLTEQGGADLIAYYPYTPDLTNYQLPIDLSDQSNPTKIDLMRGVSSRAVKVGATGAELVFSHELAQAVFSITTESGADLSALKVTLEGLTTKATYDIPTGTFVRGTEKAKVIGYTAVTSTATHAIRTLFLLPGENLSNARITFELGNRKAIFTPKAVKLEKGKKYTFHAKVTAATGTDLTVEAKVDESARPGTEPIELYPSGGEVTPTPPSPPTPTTRAAYAEIPVPVRDQGNTELVMHMAPDSWFGGNYSTPGGNGQRRNYTIYYSRDKYQPLFVAYPLYRDCLSPKVDRTDAWNYDPKVAKNWQPLLKKSYTGGYSRGHMMASSDRYGSVKLNETTFYFTNMVPQNQNQNGGVWNQLETHAQTLAKSNSNIDTLYIVCGPVFDYSNGKNPEYVGAKGDNKRIPVPTHTYKAILMKDKQDGKWHSMAVKIPNEDQNKGTKWNDRRFMVSVKSLEEELGFTFFTHLDPAIADEVKSQTTPF